MFLLFDIGGTNMRLALTDGKKILKIAKSPTPKKFQDGLKLLANMARQIHSGKFQAVVGGIAGPIDKKRQSLLGPPNLPEWANQPIQARLAKLFETKVFLENDAALAGLGEAHFGAGKNHRVIAYLTISTGIGGAKIVNGKIDDNNYGFEPGSQILNFTTLTTFENLASGKAMGLKYKKSPSKIISKEIWAKEAYYLACGLANVCVMWSPEIIILGGGIGTSARLPLRLIENKLKQVLKIFPKPPQIIKAKLGDNSGLYGALTILQKR